jgi:hypothetical protein
VLIAAVRRRQLCLFQAPEQERLRLFGHDSNRLSRALTYDNSVRFRTAVEQLCRLSAIVPRDERSSQASISILAGEPSSVATAHRRQHVE